MDAMNSAAPVTRDEMNRALEIWSGALLARIEQRIEQGDQTLLARIEQGEQRMVARIEQGEQRMVARIEQVDQTLLARIEQSEQRMLSELARHASAIHEGMRAEFAALDDKYTDLPARVRRLEVAVFPVDDH